MLYAARARRSRGPRRGSRSSTRTTTRAGREWPRSIAILERTGARDYTRDQARRYRDEALAELDAAGVVRPDARARLEEIIVLGDQRLTLARAGGRQR